MKFIIRKSRLERSENTVRLCADIVDESSDTEREIWFSADSSFSDCFDTDRADPFLIAVIPLALKNGGEIVCEMPVSERLYRNLTEYLLPLLVKLYPECPGIAIKAHTAAGSGSCRNAVGLLWENDRNSRIAAEAHYKRSEYPLTHIAVFCNKDQQDHDKLCRSAVRLAEHYGIGTVIAETNLSGDGETAEILRNAACAAALSGLFGNFIIPGFDSRGENWEKPSNSMKVRAMLSFFLSSDTLGYHFFGICMRKNIPFAVSDKTPIKFGRPYLEKTEEGVRLCARITHKDEQKTAWFEVREEYRQYLTDDRADAFAAGFLTTAMREGRDIVCEAPVTRELLYQLNYQLIPMLGQNIREYSRIRIIAEPKDEPPSCAGAVGTGWTGGVDSLFTVKKLLGAGLTHLLITSNGALEDDEGKEPCEILRAMEERALSGISEETGLSVIAVDTNLHELQTEIFITNHAFRHAAVTLALQKLFRTFLWSSGTSSLDFTFTINNDGHYEKAVFSMMSTKNTSVYSYGATYSRSEKIAALAEEPLAHRYLHPCIHAHHENCCRCAKCIRTMAALDCLDKLDDFSAVFDVNMFRKEKDWYISQLLLDSYNADARDVLEVYEKNGADLSRLKAKPETMLSEELQIIVRRSGVYSRKGPGDEYPEAYFIPNGWYRIVETVRDKNNAGWGRLLTGYGWIRLSSVRIRPEQNFFYKKCAALYHKLRG